MKCPYCGKKMEMGYIKSNELIQWVPADDKSMRPILRSSKAKNGIALNNIEEGMFYTTYKAETYYCGNCNIVVANTEE